MKKTLALLIIFVVLGAGVYYLRFQENPGKREAKQTTIEATEKSEEVVTPIGKPVNLSIPEIGVNSDIEYVGLDSKRNMDVPKKAENVAWYELGPKPGELGSAVLAGHLDAPDGSPAVFWDLKILKVGDEIITTDEDGKKQTFIVKGVESYPWDDFPLEEVFADSSGRKLNLITCEGDFDRETKNYSKRTVVYAEME